MFTYIHKVATNTLNMEVSLEMKIIVSKTINLI